MAMSQVIRGNTTCRRLRRGNPRVSERGWDRWARDDSSAALLLPRRSLAGIGLYCRTSIGPRAAVTWSSAATSEVGLRTSAVSELRRLADGNSDAVGILVESAGEREDREELRRLADA